MRTRPTFNLRGRSRGTPSSTTSATSPEIDSTEIATNNSPSISSESTPVASKPSSRFNLRRPNQLLASRGRLSPFAKTPAPSAVGGSVAATSSEQQQQQQSIEQNNNNNVTDAVAAEQKLTNAYDESEQAGAEPSTTPQTGLNRLRNRPRIQIQPKAPNPNKQPTPVSYNANRKLNPLISRRKTLGSTTTG